ncbi:glycosyltransferase [Marinobacter santoriniensis NKSG1]|uniref:Glycosyltransferase n=1 Tax=Marinobacter santoriniensis NKSG1 TaxID=1288826 RepID=M7DCL0_9GAMM|nr:selenoneine biosynthesis selenosugar synthase SenB [Marinobacter santoriniensis]EMP55402.1 glycosyltransferase [Marinobacter santoriniensis NKSG1]
MNILIITPALRGSRAGNRATAERWQRLLGTAGHDVRVITEYRGEACDLFIALHAWRSREAIAAFRADWPDLPLIVVLTGTDVYQHQRLYPEDTLASMEAATALIGLHDRVGQDIPVHLRGRLVTLRQSAALPIRRSEPPSDAFQVCVIGHLREEKDSLRAAKAARKMPPESRIRVVCAGKPHNEQWQAAVAAEVAENDRFQWVGELGEADTAALLTGSHVMVISSIMEGGANVVSEACRAGVPVVASDIPGNRGLLGDDYEGYFPVGDEAALADLLWRAEREPSFLDRLNEQVSRLAPRFTPEMEQKSLEQALALAGERCSSGRRVNPEG